MPTTSNFPTASGSQVVVGIGIETTPGVAVPASFFIDFDPDGVEGAFDPKRSTEKLAAGSIFNKRRVTDKDASVSVKLRGPLTDIQCQQLLFLCGFKDAVTASGPLATPTISSVTTATTGGTLAAGTFGYRVAANGTTGTTLPSAEVTVVTTGSTSANTINWGAVSGAASYNVYGRTSGGELLLASGVAGTSYVDTGASVPAGALPTTNTTTAAPYTHAGTITIPKYVSIYIQRAGQCELYAGQIAKTLKLTASSKKVAEYEVDFVGLKRPTDAAPLTPTYTRDYTYGPADLQPVRLLNLASNTSQDIDDIEVDVDFTIDEFRGAGGAGFPTYLTVAEADIKGKFTKVFANRDEYNLFRAAAQQPGVLGFGMGLTTARSIVLGIPGAFYPKHTWKNPSGASVVEDFDFETDHSFASPPLTLTVVNSDATVYTTV